MAFAVSLLIFNLVVIFIANISQASPQGRACCYAYTASCLSCAEGKSEEDYCQEYPETLGCERVNNQGLPQSQNQNWPSQGNPFQTLDPNLALPSPSVIIARKKRSSISCNIHESMCKYWCRVAGHSSGTCDIENECLCSEEDLEKYICDPDEEGPGEKTQHTLCAGWCQLKGKQSGDCDADAKECVCTAESLGASHAKCIDDTVCSMWCQIKERKATGKCEGVNNWDCICKSAPKEEDNEIE